MTKELEELKNALATAGSENDVLAALDGLSRELTDEEVIAVFGGEGEAESGASESSVARWEYCQGRMHRDCQGFDCSSYDNFTITCLVTGQTFPSEGV